MRFLLKLSLLSFHRKGRINSFFQLQTVLTDSPDALVNLFFYHLSKLLYSTRFMHITQLMQTTALTLMLFDPSPEYLKAYARSSIFGWVYLILDLSDKHFVSTARKYAWRRWEVPGKSDSTPGTLPSAVFSGNGRWFSLETTELPHPAENEAYLF